MKKTFIPFIILLIVIVFGLILLAIVSCEKRGPYEKFRGIDENSFEYSVLYKGCIDRNPDLRVECRDFLFQTTAESKKDTSFCERMESEKSKKECIDGVYSIQAIEEKNIETCNEIASEFEKNTCILKIQSELAAENDNISLCESLPEELVNQCISHTKFKLALLKNDPSYCDQLDDEAKQDCKEILMTRMGN